MTKYNEKIMSKIPLAVKIFDVIDKIYHSVYFLIFVALVSVLGFGLKLEVEMIFVLLLLVAINLATVRDISPSYLLAVLIALVPMNYSNMSLDGFIVLCYSLIFFVPALALRFVFFPIRFIKGKNLIPLLVYSVVLVLGGIGSGITASEYFAFVPIYTVLGLGFLQVIMYLFWQNHIYGDMESTIKYFCEMMLTIAAIAIAFVAITYIKYYVDKKPEGFTFVFFQWKNYISDILMLAMPFSFYLATKSKYRLIYFFFGMLQYVTVILTKSGGGIIFASAMMPFLLAFTIVKTEKKKRLQIIIALIALVVPIAIFVGIKWDLFYALYMRKIETGGSNRLKLYEIAIEAFKKYPIFGVGVGYVHPFMIESGFNMTYFHSTFFQALGATGIVGVCGYGYMAVCRLLTYFKKYTFNIFLIIGFLGYAGYSMVDVGTAMPFPFVMMCTFMLVLTEKYNAYRKENETNKESETEEKVEETVNPEAIEIQQNI